MENTLLQEHSRHRLLDGDAVFIEFNSPSCFALYLHIIGTIFILLKISSWSSFDLFSAMQGWFWNIHHTGTLVSYVSKILRMKTSCDIYHDCDWNFIWQSGNIFRKSPTGNPDELWVWVWSWLVQMENQARWWPLLNSLKGNPRHPIFHVEYTFHAMLVSLGFMQCEL